MMWVILIRCENTKRKRKRRPWISFQGDVERLVDSRVEVQWFASLLNNGAGGWKRLPINPVSDQSSKSPPDSHFHTSPPLFFFLMREWETTTAEGSVSVSFRINYRTLITTRLSLTLFRSEQRRSHLTLHVNHVILFLRSNLIPTLHHIWADMTINHLETQWKK